MPVKAVKTGGQRVVEADAGKASSSPNAAANGANWAATHGCGDTGAIFGLGGPLTGLIKLLGTLALIGTTPFVAVYYYVINTRFDGSMGAFFSTAREQGLGPIKDMWPQPTVEAVQYVAAFGLLQAALMLMVPGKAYYAPITPKGNQPIYKGNGVQCYLISIALLFAGWHLGVVSPGRVFDIFGNILTVLNALAFTLCAVLMVKGYVAPSSSDSGSTGNLVLDFYWGTELHPRIGKHFDIKQWTNCRMGMMGWAILILCFAFKQYDTLGYVSNSMLVSVILQEVRCGGSAGLAALAAARRGGGRAARGGPGCCWGWGSCSQPADHVPCPRRLPWLHPGLTLAAPPPSPPLSPLGLHPQVLLVGDRLLRLHGHSARPRR
jgi:7-dehydrocholesterol reductase